jgi:hypothetical protein
MDILRGLQPFFEHRSPQFAGIPGKRPAWKTP